MFEEKLGKNPRRICYHVRFEVRWTIVNIKVAKEKNGLSEANDMIGSRLEKRVRRGGVWSLIGPHAPRKIMRPRNAREHFLSQSYRLY